MSQEPAAPLRSVTRPKAAPKRAARGRAIITMFLICSILEPTLYPLFGT